VQGDDPRALEKMLPQTLKLTGRSALPLLRWADVMRAPPSQQVKTLEHMPGPSSAGFLWDLLFRRGLTRLHQMQVRGLIFDLVGSYSIPI